MSKLIEAILNILTAVFSKKSPEGVPIPSSTPSKNIPGDVSTADRIKMADFIFNYEARRDKNGHLTIYVPEKGMYEVSGITSNNYPNEAKRLASLIKAGDHVGAEREALNAIVHITDDVEDWSDVPSIEFMLRDVKFHRGLGGVSQILQKAVGASVDGKVGPKTREALNRADNDVSGLLDNITLAREWYEDKTYGARPQYRKGLRNRWAKARRDANEFKHTPPNWRSIEVKHPISTPSIIKNEWPKQIDVPKYFGKVGKNQVMLKLPYPMLVAWDINDDGLINDIRREISVHEKVHDSALRCFQRIANEYDEEQRKALGLNLWGGSLAVRRMRGGNSWSMHSWGIAIDFDPARNRLKWGKDKARLARPDCEKFFEIWEEEGWLSLGRTRNYDWMHIQAARL